MKRLAWTGLALVLLAVVGFRTVADDLRHRDEFVAVSAVGIAGVVLLVISFLKRRSRNR